MLTTLYNAVSAATDWFWGVPALVILIGGGIYLSFCTRFVQFRHFGAAMKMTIGKSFGKKRSGENGGGITGWQTVCAALSGTIGTGNIRQLRGISFPSAVPRMESLSVLQS